MAYGYLKGESGIHRLVRISPFNAEGKRQTSFAAVDVSPEVSEQVDIEIRDEDIEEQVFRASGPGGQHVNKTSSAVRLIHHPTGIAVACQSERSQHKNRATAMKMLRARLARVEEEKREAEQAAKYNQMPKVGFGSQIRSYFLHPDQRVKDARTGYTETQFPQRAGRPHPGVSRRLPAASSGREEVGLPHDARSGRCHAMSPEDIEHLKQQYAGKRVVVDARRPELARLANVPGRVVTINCNGRALVQFDGPDPGWHDIDPEFLKLEPSP